MNLFYIKDRLQITLKGEALTMPERKTLERAKRDKLVRQKDQNNFLRQLKKRQEPEHRIQNSKPIPR